MLVNINRNITREKKTLIGLMLFSPRTNISASRSPITNAQTQTVFIFCSAFVYVNAVLTWAYTCAYVLEKS